MVIETNFSGLNLGTPGTDDKTAQTHWSGIGLVSLANNLIDFADHLRYTGRTTYEAETADAARGIIAHEEITVLPVLRIPKNTVILSMGMGFAKLDSKYLPTITVGDSNQPDARTAVLGSFKLGIVNAAGDGAGETLGTLAAESTTPAAGEEGVLSGKFTPVAANRATSIQSAEQVLALTMPTATATLIKPTDAQVYVWAVVANVDPEGYLIQHDYNNRV